MANLVDRDADMKADVDEEDVDTTVSGLTKMNRSTSSLDTASDGRTRTDEMKAAWKETRMWFARTQPSCRCALFFIIAACGENCRAFAQWA